MDRPCCEYLSWDSAHFGLRIGRVNSTTLTSALTQEIESWARSQSIDCLYFLAEPEPGTMRLAANAGFRFVDVRTTFAIDLPALSTVETNEASSIRTATCEDLPDLRGIAGESHRQSRFYADGTFDVSACDEMYRIWIEKSCNRVGPASAVFVAASPGPIGYISCSLSADAGEIGLVGIDSAYRGRGWGELLVRAALAWFCCKEIKRVTVVTQGSNISAQRLYSRRGFLVSDVRLWYHRWF